MDPMGGKLRASWRRSAFRFERVAYRRPVLARENAFCNVLIGRFWSRRWVQTIPCYLVALLICVLSLPLFELSGGPEIGALRVSV
jgi:hypothetical protein